MKDLNAGEKVREIINKEFDSRLGMAVISYILDKGFEKLKEITEEEILEIPSNGLMTAEFCQALVRCAVRICKECHYIDEFLPYIVKYLYVRNAEMRDVEIYQGQMSKCGWEHLMNELGVDFHENGNEVEAVLLKATVMEVARKEEVMSDIYKIRVTETLAKTFAVKADSLDEAVDLVQKSYDNATIILDADDFDEYCIEKSPYANEDGTIEEDELDYYEKLNF